jgi:hypothetical protein
MMESPDSGGESDTRFGSQLTIWSKSTWSVHKSRHRNVRLEAQSSQGGPRPGSDATKSHVMVAIDVDGGKHAEPSTARRAPIMLR